MAASAGIAGLFLALTVGPMVDDSLKKGQHIAIEIGVGDINPQAGDSNSIPGFHNVPTDPSTTTGGMPPGFAAFDIHGNNLGRWTPFAGTNAEELKPGTPGKVITIKTGDSPPPQYLSVSAEFTDASICLAWINTIWADKAGANTYKSTWYGSVGSQCGALWYPSQLPTPSGWMPNCTWLGPPDDKNNDIYQEGMGFHIPSFSYEAEGTGNRATGGPGTGSPNSGGGKKQEYEDDNNTMCKSRPRFWMYNRLTSENCYPAFSPILQEQPDGSDPGIATEGKDPDPVLLGKSIYQPGVCAPNAGPAPEEDTNRKLQEEWPQDGSSAGGNVGSTIERRSPRRQSRRPRFDGHIVVSEHVAHNARTLCEDPRSYGPDMATTADRTHCDMETRQVSKFCDSDYQEGCFHHETKTLRRRGLLRARSEKSQDLNVFEKRYATMKHWKAVYGS